MWFKNLRVYTFAKPLAQSFEEIETALADKLFEPCGSMEKARLGWVSPLGREGEMLSHVQGPYLMLCSQKQERLLPAAVVNEAAGAQNLPQRKAPDTRRCFRHSLAARLHA